jgi:hypothetical protein
VGNAEGQKSFVEDILALQSKLETILKAAFFNQVRGAAGFTVPRVWTSGECLFMWSSLLDEVSFCMP